MGMTHDNVTSNYPCSLCEFYGDRTLKECHEVHNARGDFVVSLCREHDNTKNGAEIWDRYRLKQILLATLRRIEDPADNLNGLFYYEGAFSFAEKGLSLKKARQKALESLNSLSEDPLQDEALTIEWGLMVPVEKVRESGDTFVLDEVPRKIP